MNKYSTIIQKSIFFQRKDGFFRIKITICQKYYVSLHTISINRIRYERNDYFS